VKSTGLLAFSVPNAASIDFRLFGGAGYTLHLPAHLFHFTPTTVGRMLHVAGWEVDRILHQRSAAGLIGSVGNLIHDRYPQSKIGTGLQRFPVTHGRLHGLIFPAAYLLSLFGQTGRMTVWARPA
jgi:hypothetical protein